MQTLVFLVGALIGGFGIFFTAPASPQLQQDEQTFGATVFVYQQGGTGTTTAPVGQLLYGGSSSYQSVATSAASCSSGVSCSAFTVVGTAAPSITSSLGTSIDISDETNLSVSYPITLTGDTVGYNGLATTSPFSTNGFVYTNNAGALVTAASSSLSLPNTALQNSTISGIALGSNLANLTATDSTLTFSGTYNGSTARTIGLNLGNANTWTARQTFEFASTTGYHSFLTASSTNWIGGGLTDCDADNQTVSYDITTMKFGCGDDDNTGGGGGSGSVSTSTTDTANQVTFFTSNSATPALIGGDSGLTYSSAADRLTVVYASTTALSSGYASSTTAHFGTLTLTAPLGTAYGGTGAATLNDLITLTTHTAGNYVATLADDGQSTVTVTNGSAEGGAATLRVIDVVCTGCLGATEIAGLGTADISGLDISDDTNLAATWPIVLTGDTLSFDGLSTSSAPSIGNLAYWTGAKTLGTVATGTVSDSGLIGVTAGQSVIGSGLTISLDNINANTVIGNNTGASAAPAAFATSSLFAAGSAGNVLGYTNGVWAPMATATCVQITGSAGLCDGDDATAAGAANDFTFESNYGAVNAATSSIIWAKSGLNASSTSNFVYASTTALSASGDGFISGILRAARFIVTGIAAAFTPSVEGELGFDTTSNQFKYFSGGAVRTIAPDLDSAFVFATSTLGSGTTTIKVSGYSRATTFAKIGCVGKGSGTFVAQLGNGTASTTAVVSATANTTTFTTISANNSFTAGEVMYWAVGSVSGTVADPSCSYNRAIIAD